MRLANITESDEIKPERFLSIITSDVRNLMRIFEQVGYEIRIAGGAVRDIILGRDPKDIDFATTATPEQMMDVLGSHDIHYVPTGLQHGTITAVVNNEPYEITTLRTETDHTGRHATVEWTTDWKEDASRRDLTFNAMYIDMNGKIYDYFGGLEDLTLKRLRFVGMADERIQEDYLRILRYFRFIGKIDNSVEDLDAERSIVKNAQGLKEISGERIWMEISKILTGNNLFHILLYMKRLNVASVIGLPIIHDTARKASRVSKKTDNPVTVLSTLTSVEDFNGIVERWKLSNAESKLGLFLIENMYTPLSRDDMENMLIAGVPRNYLVELLLIQDNPSLLSHVRSWNMPSFPIGGNDLIELGMKPGPEMGKTLSALKKKWIDSRFSLTRENLLDMIHTL